MNMLQPVVEDEALVALRRTLWQLAAVGIVAALAIEWLATDAGALALWCALVPLCALAAHFRQELASLWGAQESETATRLRARRGTRPRSGDRRRPTMAVRHARASRLAGAR